MQAQKAGGAVASFVRYPLNVRMENALVAYVRYLGKAVLAGGICAHVSASRKHAAEVADLAGAASAARYHRS